MKIKCDNCGKIFERRKPEVSRSKKLGRKSYCSRSCTGKVVGKNLRKGGGDVNNLNPSNRLDKYSPYRPHMRRLIRRYPETNVDLEYLKEVFDRQKGVCVYSGVNLKPPKYKNSNNQTNTSSVDRIDSSLPYVRGNIQFISIAMNHLKNSMGDKELREYLKSISNYLSNL